MRLDQHVYVMLVYQRARRSHPSAGPGRSVPSRSSMHAMACLTADVRVLRSVCRLFSSLGVTAQNTWLTARKRLFRATEVSDAEQLARHCYRRALGQLAIAFQVCVVGIQPAPHIRWVDELCPTMRSLSVSHQVLERIDSSSIHRWCMGFYP